MELHGATQRMTQHAGLEIINLLFPVRICACLLGYLGKWVKEGVSGYIIFIGF
jgi:hypothetical protein